MGAAIVTKLNHETKVRKIYAIDCINYILLFSLAQTNHLKVLTNCNYELITT